QIIVTLVFKPLPPLSSEWTWLRTKLSEVRTSARIPDLRAGHPGWARKGPNALSREWSKKSTAAKPFD
ncbi:uncharacterized protein METZ01_LOCUS372486, partial [marine metagenome]